MPPLLLPPTTLVMLMKMRYLLAISMLVLACPLAAQVYKWVDGDGNIIYSDTPHPGAEEIPATEVQTIKMPPLPKAEKKPPAKPKALPYQTLSITRPADGETVRDNTGQVEVSVSLKPPLQVRYGHRLQLQLDGRPYAEAGTTTGFQLQNLDRGAHSLLVQVLDKEGRVFASSTSVVFYLHRQTVHRP